MKLIFLISACIALATAEIYVNKFPFYKPKVSSQNRTGVSPRIINGTEVKPHSIPYQVWLTVKGQTIFESWRCGGVLISKNYVLTAAHCGYKALSATILLGAHDITKNEPTQVTIGSKSIKIHEKFGGTENADGGSNDVCVIELEKPVTFNDNIQPAKLPSKKDATKTYAGQLARVSGWGLTKGNGQLSNVLNAEESSVIENSECQKTFDEVDIDEGIICTSGADNKSSCNGDSGGPLTSVADDTVIGIVSFGVNYCPPGNPSAFARVTNYLEWIEKNSDITLV